MENKYLGVYIGRFSPMHLGHQAVIDTMINKHGIENSLVLIGSANAPQSLRHFFTYQERREIIKTVYPRLNVAPLPDFKDSNDEWYGAIRDLLRLAGGGTGYATFYAGCVEDVMILKQYTPDIVYCNRFDGTTPPTSATEVRDMLMNKRSLEGFVDPSLEYYIPDIFNKRWKEFQNK